MLDNTFTKRHMLEYVGDFSQLFGIKDYTLSSGKAKGVRAFDINNGSGLEFTVIADRCLDIAGLSFKGTNCSYISKSGIVAPAFYEKDGIEFLRSFFAGFLTTCGLRNAGAPCEENGDQFGLHGRISNTPAEEVNAAVTWKNDLPTMTISGLMREARLFGENLVLRRHISCKYGENKITLHNSIENLGFKKEPLMLLFHFNLGYPLLDEHAELVTSTSKLTARNDVAKEGINEYAQFQPPTAGYVEKVFYHALNSDSKGRTAVALVNKKLGLGVALHFNQSELSNFTQWKQMGQGEYVLGMEPCNCTVDGRVNAREQNTLEYLEPGEIKRFDIEIEIMDGLEEIQSMTQAIENLGA
jgi:hypothetical protein